MQDLNDLVYFAAVVTHRGFSPAARALGLPKSSLSRRVTRLEARLGVRLLERSTRRFNVTEIGQEFYRHCRAVMDDAEAAEEVAARVHAEPTGLVRVSCPPGMAQGAIAKSLPAFLAAHPKLRLHLIVTNRRIELIDEGVDVAVRVRTRLDSDGGYQMRAFGQSRTLLVASPGVVERFGQPGRPQDFSRLPTISMTTRPGRDIWTLTGPNNETLAIEHEPILACDDFGVLLQAALDGVGFALLPESVCGDAVAGRALIPVLPEWRSTDGIVHLVFTSRRGLLPAVRAVIDFLAEKIAADCKIVNHMSGVQIRSAER